MYVDLLHLGWEDIMQRKLTITIEEDVYEGLSRAVGRGEISGFIEEVARPHVVDRERSR